MEIRTLTAQERTKVAALLDGWRVTGGWSAGDRFRQQAEWDPTWHDENVFIVLEQDRVVATATIVPRALKILGHVIPIGGIGNLYTEPSFRERGIATEVMDRACDAMRARGLELAVAFTGAPPATPEFFEKRGWFGWGGQQTILRVDPDPPIRPTEDGDEIEIVPIGPGDDRALQSVKSIHVAYAASRSGTVVRDDALWQSCLQLTPAPREEFLIARRGGLTVAYARASLVDDVLMVTELGRFEDGADALARLIGTMLSPRDKDPLAPSGCGDRAASEQLRSFAVLPTFDDIGLTVALEHRGVRSHPMDEAKANFRCVNLIGFASRLDVDLLPDEEGVGFLRRILPPDAMVFWPADRF